MHKEVDLVVDLSALVSEHFYVEPGHERQKLVCSGRLVYPKLTDWVVEANFQSRLPVDDRFSYSKSTIELYGEQSRLGVAYVKKEPIDQYTNANLSIFIEVPNPFILKMHQIISSGLVPTLLLKILVDGKFLKDTYVEPRVPELKAEAEFTDIDTSELVTCAVIEMSLRLNH